jgi:TPR repeat protein
VEAVKWYRKAAEQNLTVAQDILGACYLTGRGVAQNPKEGIKWFEKAAERNFFNAQFQLGLCYAGGLHGAAKDYVQAYKWLSLASSQMPEAKYDLDMVLHLMDPQQLFQGWHLVQAFKPIEVASPDADDSPEGIP